MRRRFLGLCRRGLGRAGRRLVPISLLVTLGASVWAEDNACRSLGALTPELTPPVTVRIALDCIREERFDDAVGVFLAYNSYSLFDRMRIRDKSAHVVAAEMDDYLLSGLSLDQIEGVRAALARLRGGDMAFRDEVCGTLRRLGPPSYKPDYMIWRGEVPLKTETDWRVPDFDAEIAWERAVGEFNRC